MTPFRKRSWKDFSSILNELRRSEKWGRHLSRHPVFRVWKSVVGEAIAKVAQPIGVKGSCLRVEVAESAWMQELQLMADDMLGMVNSALENGNLKEIQFRLGNSNLVKNGMSGSDNAGKAHQAFRRPAGLSDEDKLAARDMLRNFQDEELRDRAESLLDRVHSWSPVSEEGEKSAMNPEERG